MSSHSRSPSPPRRSRSRSRSRQSRERSRSRSRYSRRTSPSPSRSRSRTSFPRPTKVYGDRENPTSSKCLGVFGLNFTTTETDLDREFRRYGKIEKVQVVLDGPTKRSRGFAFIYFEQMEDAEKARDAMNGTEISGFKIRVDFSITNAAHRPTPGVYFHHGKATRPGFRLRDSRRGGRGDYRDRHHERDHRHHEERDRYHDRRPPPSYYDRGETKHVIWCHVMSCDVMWCHTNSVWLQATTGTTTAHPGTGRRDTTTTTGTRGTRRGRDTTRTGSHTDLQYISNC